MTIRKTARFAVDREHLDTAVDAIRTFVAHTATEPGTLLYESWQSTGQPTEFLHLMAFADEDAERAHATSQAVRAFTEVLYPICTSPPTFADWTALGPEDDR